MWIFLNDAFLSIVSKDCGPDELLVRARARDDIERVFPSARVTYGTGTDYLARAKVRRSEVARVLTERVMNLDCDNFKDSVFESDRCAAYYNVWKAMADYQDRQRSSARLPDYLIRRS